jgi:hypothetical protein
MFETTLPLHYFRRITFTEQCARAAAIAEALPRRKDQFLACPWHYEKRVRRPFVSLLNKCEFRVSRREHDCSAETDLTKFTVLNLLANALRRVQEAYRELRTISFE